MEEIDVWRTARVLIKQHGDAAGFVAAQRADALLEKNDYLGVTVWMRVKRAIGGRERVKPRDGESVN